MSSREKHRWTRQLGRILAPLLALGVAVACAPQEPANEEGADETAEEMATEAEDGAPRVFFVEPEDGATVQSPVQLVFGAENYVVEPVADGEVHEGAGHLHIGVDTECLPPGEVIPQAFPWFHYGDAAMQTEIQLPAGEHTLCLQTGDGEHRTVDEPGLCECITLNVVEEEAAEE